MARFTSTYAFSGKKYSQTCVNCRLIHDNTYKEEILDNHMSVLCDFGNSAVDEELDLLKLHVSLQTALYCWVCQVLHKTFFQIVSNQNYISISI